MNLTKVIKEKVSPLNYLLANCRNIDNRIIFQERFGTVVLTLFVASDPLGSSYAMTIEPKGSLAETITTHDGIDVVRFLLTDRMISAHLGPHAFSYMKDVLGLNRGEKYRELAPHTSFYYRALPEEVFVGFLEAVQLQQLHFLTGRSW